MPARASAAALVNSALRRSSECTVTVDMIATGTDIKPLEVLFFLRDVRSRVYFEQMKRRGNRVLTASEMQAVSGKDARTKDHFVALPRSWHNRLTCDT